MSRIGKKPIEIPEGVKVELTEKEAKVLGPKGELIQTIHPEIKIESKDGMIFVSPKTKLSKKGRGLWGLYRALLANMVEGVSKGFEKKLEIEGVDFLVEKNVITVSGIDKERVGHMAALIRKQKKAEPYKGKGIKYQGEVIRRKEGKKVV